MAVRKKKKKKEKRNGADALREAKDCVLHIKILFRCCILHSYALLRVTLIFVVSLLYLVVKAQQCFVTSSCMFLDKKTLLEIWLNPWLNFEEPGQVVEVLYL